MAEAAERLWRAEEDRERDVRELSAARVIQQQLLPKTLPSFYSSTLLGKFIVMEQELAKTTFAKSPSSASILSDRLRGVL